jgi:hypothetical protein
MAVTLGGVGVAHSRWTWRLVLAVAAMCTACGDASEGGGAADIPPTMPVVDATTVSSTATGTGDAAGIEVSIGAPGQILAGTRAAIDVTIRNAGMSTVYWQAGGCSIPAAVTFGPVGAELAGEPPQPQDLWDGSSGSLASWLEDHNGVVVRGTQPQDQTGWRAIACTANSEMRPFDPGESLTYPSTIDLRLPPGDLPAGGDYEAVATFTGYPSELAYPQQTLSPVEARIAIIVVDDPRRAGTSVDDIVDRVNDDDRLASWVPTTKVPGRPDLPQAYSATLEWWRDAWELWAQPYWQGDESIRVRVDPATLDIVDVRFIYGGAPPEDEPGVSDVFTRTEPDRVLTEPIGNEPGAIAQPSQVRVGDQIDVIAQPEVWAVCSNIALIYEVNGDGEHERGLIINQVDATSTWNTAPAGLPITIPPCMSIDPSTTFTYTVPVLAPGSYQICLTRESDACADFEIVE